jgi:hypothetical protein
VLQSPENNFEKVLFKELTHNQSQNFFSYFKLMQIKEVHLNVWTIGGCGGKWQQRRILKFP